MATTEQLQALLDESRNGCDHYVRHALARRFVYTDGVDAMAQLCGAYWLLDVIGTQAVPSLIKDYQENYGDVGLIEISVIEYNGVDCMCKVTLTIDDDHPPIWRKDITYTDFPAGKWVFKLGLDRDTDGAMCGVMCLLSED